MAGEWIAYDLALPSKPEVQELIDLTDDPIEVVVYRLLQLWGWASLHCEEGKAKMTPTRLCRVVGGTIELTGLLCESSSGGRERQWRRCC
jgi:hypothetical protein